MADAFASGSLAQVGAGFDAVLCQSAGGSYGGGSSIEAHLSRALPSVAAHRHAELVAAALEP
ncbi:hypothetical protein [Ornithinimicrobium sp. INDO-MA30-4]|uniref:hypothetical protein n=1 Tax=Ornithinimicrobium sp. INDO-MA30-4 TaxID=2908651 RepID=UPI001F2DDD95|nr:hypothetical protein [Ornithinimicrobium sp. INDO-MA30-4]UJH70423.1 hypothetical protein L0A91_15110 [Ornithinimicrobium sp. INDO-MA30-4]